MREWGREKERDERVDGEREKQYVGYNELQCNEAHYIVRSESERERE